MFTCNHEEADTRMIYHASLQGSSKVIISASDIDVMFLAVYTCALDTSRAWYVNYQFNTYTDAQEMAKILGNAALYLPLFML